MKKNDKKRLTFYLKIDIHSLFPENVDNVFLYHYHALAIRLKTIGDNKKGRKNKCQKD